MHHILTRSNTSLSLVLSEFNGPYCARRKAPPSSPSTRPSALASSNNRQPSTHGCKRLHGMPDHAGLSRQFAEYTCRAGTPP